MRDPSTPEPASIPTPALRPDPATPAGRGAAVLRASDDDRERVAEVVRRAAVDGRLDMAELDERLGAVYAARTYGELAETTADLPDTAGPSPSPARPLVGPGASRDPAVAAPVVVSGPAAGAAVAVFSGTKRTGRWTVPEQLSAIAVMGAVELDLREADLAAREVVVTVFALFGSVEIVVPEGLTVRADGMGLFGQFDSAGAGEAGPDVPVLVVRGAAVFGSVDVRRKPPRQPGAGRRDRDRLHGADTHDRELGRGGPGPDRP